MHDLTLSNGGWRNYPDLNTDSLWIIDKRDNSGAHKGDYHGNFVPQIPNQFIRRFTKHGDLVMDFFAGSGTTLIEAKKLGRRSVGFDINDEALAMAQERIDATDGEFEPNLRKQDCLGRGRYGVHLDELFSEFEEKASLVILHPPYHNIIEYNSDLDCLSQCGSLQSFKTLVWGLANVASGFLKKGGHVVLVIGDMYSKGEYIRLADKCWDQFEPMFDLRADIIKNMKGNEKGKGRASNLWRYRHLAHGSFDFSHEHIFLGRKAK